MPGVWIQTAPRVILKKLFSVARCVVTEEELPGKHSLSACCEENSQTRPFSYYFLSVADTYSQADVYHEEWATVGEEANGTGGDRGQERGMEKIGRGGYWSQGGVMVSQWREIVENIRNFHHGIPCN